MKTARVIEEHKTNFIILDQTKELVATVRGTFFTNHFFPKVGDFVLYTELKESKAVIEEVVPRTSAVVRKAVETETTQTIVANVDLIFIVMGLDNDFSLSRLERYILLARQSEVKPIVILNKSDIADDVSEYVQRVKEVAGEVPVHAVSATTGKNMDTLSSLITKDVTVVLLGSSGAGKSTITNWLLKEEKQQINNVRTNDSKGRHTTTSRQLFSLPSGGYLIDTPGMRELSVLDTKQEDEGEVFSKINTLSEQCQYNDCDHEKSSGCAVLTAILAGDISARQLENFHKLQKERLFQESKHNAELSLLEKKRKKKLHKGYDAIVKQKRIDEQF